MTDNNNTISINIKEDDNNNNNIMKDDNNTSEEGKTITTKQLSFGNVRVREHERVLNTRGSARYAELSLGWNCKEKSSCFDLEEFEESRKKQQGSSSSLSSSLYSPTSSIKKGQRCTARDRIALLNEYGYGIRDIIQVEHEKKKDLEERRKRQQAAKEKEKGQGRKSKSTIVRRALNILGLTNKSQSKKEKCEKFH